MSPDFLLDNLVIADDESTVYGALSLGASVQKEGSETPINDVALAVYQTCMGDILIDLSQLDQTLQDMRTVSQHFTAAEILDNLRSKLSELTVKYQINETQLKQFNPEIKTVEE